jgi:hypothetical protein
VFSSSKVVTCEKIRHGVLLGVFLEILVADMPKRKYTWNKAGNYKYKFNLSLEETHTKV